MGDAGEGLIDADARIQERMEELERERKVTRGGTKHEDPELVRRLEGLRLARLAQEGMLQAATNERHRALLTQSIEDIDRQIAAARAPKAASGGR